MVVASGGGWTTGHSGERVLGRSINGPEAQPDFGMERVHAMLLRERLG